VKEGGEYLEVPNWDKYQHYKDRKPPWIKLHSQLLNNEEFAMLSGGAAKLLIYIWLLASEGKGYIEYDVHRIAFRTRMDDMDVADLIGELLKAKLLFVSADGAEEDEWPSRYIPVDVRSTVFLRDKGECQMCGSKERIEYDHIIPVSAGGESTVANIQLLCRPCNRRKRVSVAPATQSVAKATKKKKRRSLETETEKSQRAS
jgi:hypothetical protein